jgi:hypothetical protein
MVARSKEGQFTPAKLLMRIVAGDAAFLSARHIDSVNR